MWYRSWIVVLLIGMCLSACADIVASESQWDGSDVMGSTVWHLVELNGAPVTRTDVTIQYENLNLAGDGFCAVYRIAPVTTGEHTTRIDTIATPPHDCAPADTQHERDYMAALMATTAIAVVDHNLVFYAAAGQPVLVYAP